MDLETKKGEMKEERRVFIRQEILILKLLTDPVKICSVK